MKLALIGKNISYSLSPLIHTLLFKKHGINASYALMDIDEINPADILDLIKNDVYKSFNVTIPYKASFKSLKCNNPHLSQNIINCIYKQDGNIFADNTDYWGFLYSLEHFAIKDNIKSAVIMGTGSSAICIKDALKGFVDDIIFVSRSPKAAIDGFKVISYADLKGTKADILINCTPIGSQVDIGSSPDIHSIISNFKYFYSLSYISSFYFANRGVQSINGLVMLIAQAIYAQNLFFKENYDIKEDVNYILSILENNYEDNDY